MLRVLSDAVFVPLRARRTRATTRATAIPASAARKGAAAEA